MTKKLVFLMLVLIVASSSFGQLVSPPSNVVGYVKVDVPVGTVANPFSKAFGLPLKFWTVSGTLPQYGNETFKPSSIVGTQANPNPNGVGGTGQADRIIQQNNGALAARASSGTWSGNLEVQGANGLMFPGRGYFYVNKSGVARTLVLAGQVDNATIYVGDTIFAPASGSPGTFSNPVSWRDSRDRIQDDLNLLASGFQGANTSQFADRVIAQAGGAFFWRRSSDNSWQTGAGNPLTTVSPGLAYWIQNRHNLHQWVYVYDYSGNSAIGDNPVNPSVSSIKNNVIVPTSKVDNTSKTPMSKVTVPVTKTETKTSAPATKAAK